jgi:uncharacterized protein YyaL (SSP411 family)
LTDSREYERIAAAAIRSVRDLMIKYPSGFGQWLCALDYYLSQPQELAVIGAREDPATRELMSAINRRYLPNRVLAGRSLEDAREAARVPILEDKSMLDNRPTAYVCVGSTCLPPVAEPAELEAILDRT